MLYSKRPSVFVSVIPVYWKFKSLLIKELAVVYPSQHFATSRCLDYMIFKPPYDSEWRNHGMFYSVGAVKYSCLTDPLNAWVRNKDLYFSAPLELEAVSMYLPNTFWTSSENHAMLGIASIRTILL